MPICVSYRIGNDGEVKYYLAPKILDDDWLYDIDKNVQNITWMIFTVPFSMLLSYRAWAAWWSQCL